MAENQGGGTLVKSPQDFAAGITMVILGLGAWYFAKDLKLGTGANLGPGSFPIGISLIIASLGGLLCFNATRKEGEQLDWHFMRMLGFLVFLAVAFYILELISSTVLNKFGVSSKIFPWSTMLPAIAIIGVIFYTVNLGKTNEAVGRWIMRGPLFIVASICMFALLIRPMGLAIAGPVMIVLAVNSQDEVDWKETIIFAIIMTVLCVGLFRYALKQAIPILPWLNI